MSNLTFSLVMAPLEWHPPHSEFVHLCIRINAWPALFNMIPAGVFDGREVFLWNEMA
ncbi:MAG: hypothetical protein JW839_10940 [Candidatus Lokiarchaeota archaeon]|nr:hypothetical protein [Candidatus Lokiarchaeota archaeon]